ncbi:MAG: cyclic nucleotide-binding domain-containing protein, partial [Gaiella sp.]
ARVLGTLEGLLIGAIGIGAALAPALAAWLGVDGALLATGLLLPVLTIASLLALREADRRGLPSPHLAVLRRLELLAPLPEAVLEHLARGVERLELAEGTVVIRAGEAGDRFYAIEAGEVEVAGRTLGAGDGFGEIALLRDVPRTSTVTARTAVVLLALERDDFLAAVTGNEGARAAADAVVTARLARHAGRTTVTSSP